MSTIARLVHWHIRGGHQGAKLGLLLSLAYTLIIALVSDPHPLGVLFVFLYGAVLAVLPSILLGFLTGWCIEVIVGLLRDHLAPGTAFLVGVVFCLVVALAFTFPSWFPWIRYPMFFHARGFQGFLVYGGIPALIYVIAGGWATRRSFQKLQQLSITESSRILETRRVSSAVPFIGLITIGGLWYLFSYSSQTTYEFYILPKGYVGPVVVVFDQESGQPAEHEGGVRIYRIPRTGVLYTQFPSTHTYHAKFWYEDEKGQRIEIPVVNSSCSSPAVDDIVFACNRSAGIFTRGRIILEHRSYLVGTKNQMEGDKLQKIIDDVLWPLSDQ